MSDQTDILSTMARDGAPLLKARDKEMIPTVLLRAMLILALSALAITSYAVLTDRPLVGQPLPADVVKSREIVLLGDPGNPTGAIRVMTPEGVSLLDGGETESGFLAVIFRAMTRVRGLNRVTSETPLLLEARANGRLTVSDPETGWSVELGSFGALNRDAFAALLD